MPSVLILLHFNEFSVILFEKIKLKEVLYLNNKTENLYKQMEKNTVDSKNQLANSKFVRFKNPEGKGARIMFVGNSITLHGISTSIGWNLECGMAASSEENDYVHIIMNKVNRIKADSAFCICQVAEWEREYKNGTGKLPLFENACDFGADIIIARFIENCPADNFDFENFKTELDALLKYLNKSGKAKIVITTGFWRHPGDSAIIEYAAEKNIPLIELGDLGEKDEMKAIGLFEHNGVANHPGDLGMKHIAERIFVEIEKLI